MDRLNIRNHVIDYYANLFQEEGNLANLDFDINDELIPHSVSIVENSCLPRF